MERIASILPTSRGDEEVGVTKFEGKSGTFFIEDEIRVPINKPNIERMPGVLR